MQSNQSTVSWGCESDFFYIKSKPIIYFKNPNIMVFIVKDRRQMNYKNYFATFHRFNLNIFNNVILDLFAIL